jgi:hypothetical protein
MPGAGLADSALGREAATIDLRGDGFDDYAAAAFLRERVHDGKSLKE